MQKLVKTALKKCRICDFLHFFDANGEKYMKCKRRLLCWIIQDLFVKITLLYIFLI